MSFILDHERLFHKQNCGACLVNVEREPSWRWLLVGASGWGASLSSESGPNLDSGALHPQPPDGKKSG